MPASSTSLRRATIPSRGDGSGAAAARALATIDLDERLRAGIEARYLTNYEDSLSEDFIFTPSGPDESNAEMLTMLFGQPSDERVVIDSDRDRAVVVVTSTEMLNKPLALFVKLHK